GSGDDVRDERRVAQVAGDDAGAGPTIGQPQLEALPQAGRHDPADEPGRASDQHRALNPAHSADDSMSPYVFTNIGPGRVEVRGWTGSTRWTCATRRSASRRSGGAATTRPRSTRSSTGSNRRSP